LTITSGFGRSGRLCEILGLLKNPTFGMAEIKREVQNIEGKLDDPFAGLLTIKKEVHKLEKKLDSPDHGLEEIKKEIRDIEGKLDDPDSGLAEITRQIQDIRSILADPGSAPEIIIQTTLADPASGLDEIKKEIQEMQTTLADPISGSGLDEIKKEIQDVRNAFAADMHPWVVTTGPVVKDSLVQSLFVLVQNNLASTQTAIVNVFKLAPCRSSVPPSPFILTINSNCSDFVLFDLTEVELFEVQITYSTGQGIYSFVAGRSQSGTEPPSPSNLIDANTFRNRDLVPKSAS